MSAYLFLLSMYFLAKPFYVFPSGLPQPAEGFLISLCILILIHAPVHRRSSFVEVRFWGFLFFGYAFAVNSVWGLLLDDVSIAYNGIFYIFNGITLFVVIYIIEEYGRKALLTIFKVSALSAAMQVAGYFLFHNTDEYGIRSTGFFENPNQLGYWCLLCATIIFMIQQKCRISVLFSTSVVLSLMSLSIVSLSRGALIAFIALLGIHFRYYTRSYITFISIMLVIIVFFFFSTELFSKIFLSLGHGKYDNLESRGYDLIFQYWQYLFFGAGEGGWMYRFNRVRELHSTFGTLFFCYGIIGMMIFIYFITRLFRTSGVSYALYLLPAFLYGLGHQGLRFTLFWVVVGLVATIGIADTDDVKHKEGNLV